MSTNASDPSGSLPERSKDCEDGLAAAPSKNALKKAAKEKEKAEKAAKRKEAEEKQRQEAAASDVSANDYGDLPLVGSKDFSPSGVKRVTLDEIAEQYKDTIQAEGTESPAVVFRAVVENAREQSAKLAFLVLGYRLSSIQAVVAASETVSRQMVKFASRIPAQSQVLVHGLVKQPKELVKSTTIGYLEVQITKIYVIVRAPTILPIQVEDCERPLPEENTEDTSKADDGRPLVTLNTRLNNRTMDLRAKLNYAIFCIKDGVCALFSEFLRAKGFVGVQTPKILGGSSEGGSSVFHMQYFNIEASLAQSPQLAKQMLIASQFERVFEIGPVFRAENSNTIRHLTEFTGLDLEMVFEEDYHEVVDILEELMLYIFNGLRTRYMRYTEIVKKAYQIEDFSIPAFGKTPRIHFADGVGMLRQAGVEIGDFDDLNTAQEKLLGRLVFEKYGSDFYILDQYPLVVRPYYTMPSSSTFTEPPARQYSNSYDFHMRGTEILSGAQRVHDPDLLVQRMKAQDPPIDPTLAGIKDYVDAFRNGCPQHAGAGLGLERIVMLWLGLPNVRLASLFPRDPNRVAP